VQSVFESVNARKREPGQALLCAVLVSLLPLWTLPAPLRRLKFTA
jgi:hypothetical protein